MPDLPPDFPPPNPKDLAYTIVLVLFALSLIAERVANLWKLKSDDLKLPKLSKSEEKDRERKIMWRAIISGWLVAAASGADFFTLIRHGRLLDYFGGGTPSFLEVLQSIIGILLTGIFISLGSKFWHDMLDIVLQISNLKKLQVETASDNAQAANAQLLASNMKLLDSKLRADFPASYRGYDLVPGTNKVSLKFEEKSFPADGDLATIKSALGADNVSFVKSNLKG